MKKLSIFEQAIPCIASDASIVKPQSLFMAYWKNGGYGNWSNSDTNWKNSGGWSNSDTNWKNSGGWSNSDSKGK